MVNKLIASVVLGVAIIIWGFGNQFVLENGANAVGIVYLTTLVLLLVSRQGAEAGDMVGTIVGTVTGALWYIVWFGIAAVIYNLFNMLMAGGGDVMGLVWVLINTAIAVVTSALGYGATDALIKAE